MLFELKLWIYNALMNWGLAVALNAAYKAERLMDEWESE